MQICSIKSVPRGTGGKKKVIEQQIKKLVKIKLQQDIVECMNE